MTKKVRNPLGILTLVVFAVLFTGEEQATFAKDETVRQTFPLTPGGRITLDNSRGNIRISSWDQDRVELVAEKSGDSQEDMDLVPIEIDSREDELTITSLFPEYAPDLYVKVNYQLRVPRQVDLKLVHTINGDVQVSDVSGRAILLTDHGPITVKGFSGILRAESLSYGPIEVELTKVDTADHFDLQNMNGAISVRIPKDVDAFWIVRTLNGKIDSDVPLEVRDNFGPNVAHHPNETGEPLVRLYSVNGDIQIDQK